MRCYLCESEVRVVTEPREVPEGRGTVLIDDTFYRCDACGETFYDGDMTKESFRRATEAARREYKLLMPNEIRELRGMYGLSQASLEKLINSGEKTVVRWEKGSVAQNATADTLLRILREHPEVVEKLAAARGVKVSMPQSARSAA